MKVLVIRFSSIGDVVLTTPILRGLKRQLEQGSEIHFLTKKSMGDLMLGAEGVDELLFLEQDGLFSRLRRENYDAIVDLHKNFRTSKIKALLWYIPSYTYNKKSLQRWLFVKTHHEIFQVNHVTERYWQSVLPLGVINDGLGTALPSFESAVGDSFGLEPLPKNYGVAFLGGTYFTKKIPLKVWQNILSQQTLPTLLLGGIEDRELAQQILNLTQGPVISWVGKTDLKTSARAVQMAKWVIGGDTGFSHIAAAYRRPLLVIWGNTHPGLGFGPEIQPSSMNAVLNSDINDEKNGPYKATNSVISGLPCHPCSKLGFDACPKGHFTCMYGQSDTELSRMLQKLQGI